MSNTLLKTELDQFKTEPGYYADGKFGIRIESVVIVKEAKTPNNFGDKGFLAFEHLTMASYFEPFKPLPNNYFEISVSHTKDSDSAGALYIQRTMLAQRVSCRDLC